MFVVISNIDLQGMPTALYSLEYRLDSQIMVAQGEKPEELREVQIIGYGNSEDGNYFHLEEIREHQRWVLMTWRCERRTSQVMTKVSVWKSEDLCAWREGGVQDSHGKHG